MTLRISDFNSLFEFDDAELKAHFSAHQETISEYLKIVENQSGYIIKHHDLITFAVNLLNKEEAKKIEKIVSRILQEIPDTFQFEANPRAGSGMRIFIDIANLKKHDLNLTEEDLGKIFELANQHTLNVTYPCMQNSREISGRMVHRPNHNGSHAARQARYFDALVDIIKHKGSKGAQAVINDLSEDERLNLKLAAYFLRSGRVDESSHRGRHPDDYYTRSALIYEHYAKQLTADENTVAWGKKLIINSCKPEGIREATVEKDVNPKNWYCFQLLTFAHELDLMRCFRPHKMEGETIPSMKDSLEDLISDEHLTKRDQYMDQLLQFAKDVCAATGARRAYDNEPGDSERFSLCSTEGKTCWEYVKEVPLPSWR